MSRVSGWGRDGTQRSFAMCVRGMSAAELRAGKLGCPPSDIDTNGSTMSLPQEDDTTNPGDWGHEYRAAHCVQPGDFRIVWTDKTVLNKSELGKAAIAHRLASLPFRLRPALILVDGKRTVAELQRLLESLGGTLALEELLALGMVDEPQTAAAPVPAIGSEVAESPAQVMPFADFAQAVGAFFDRELGPNGQMLVLQIGAAKDMRTLKPLVDRGLDNLKYFKGAGAVADFRATLGQQAPRS